MFYAPRRKKQEEKRANGFHSYHLPPPFNHHDLLHTTLLYWSLCRFIAYSVR